MWHTPCCECCVVTSLGKRLIRRQPRVGVCALHGASRNQYILNTASCLHTPTLFLRFSISCTRLRCSHVVFASCRESQRSNANVKCECQRGGEHEHDGRACVAGCRGRCAAAAAAVHARWRRGGWRCWRWQCRLRGHRKRRSQGRRWLGWRGLAGQNVRCVLGIQHRIDSGRNGA